MPVRPLQPYPLVAHLEGGQEPAARCEDPVELREGGREFVLRHVHRRVPGEDPAQRVARQVGRRHRPHLEARPRTGRAGDLDHARRQAHPNASAPMSRRWDVTRPVPQPRSPIVRGPPARAPHGRVFRTRPAARPPDAVTDAPCHDRPVARPVEGAGHRRGATSPSRPGASTPVRGVPPRLAGRHRSGRRATGRRPVSTSGRGRRGRPGPPDPRPRSPPCGPRPRRSAPPRPRRP